MEIVSGMDKIWRLENDQATDIIAKVGFSREEAIEIIKSDPFAPKMEELRKNNKLVDTDYKEI